MELHQAFVALLEGETGPAARAAVERLRSSALEMARADGRRPSDHDDCAQDVAIKLWKRLSMGECPVRMLSAPSCHAYVRTMVENWLTDRYRREQRHRAKAKRLQHEPEVRVENAEDEIVAGEDASSARERRAKVRALLDRVARAAIERRSPRHRPHLEQGWREIEQMVFGGVPLSALLVLQPGEDFLRARNAAYKRQERTRTALEEAIEALGASGALDAEETELARLAVAMLARCQRSDAGGVEEKS